jgi:hypothetical protein
LLSLSNSTLDFWDNEDDEIWNDVWAGRNSINSCSVFQFIFHIRKDLCLCYLIICIIRSAMIL